MKSFLYAIRKKFVFRYAVTIFCSCMAFFMFFLIGHIWNYQIVATIIACVFGFGSIIWFAFSNLDIECPVCRYNLVMDIGILRRTILKEILFGKSVVCPNCKIELK